MSGPSRGTAIGCSVGALTVALLAATALLGSPGVRHPQHGRDRVLGPTDPAKRIDVSLVLRLPHAAALNRFLAASADPRSPSYGAKLHPQQFGARFGLPLTQIAVLRSALATHGLTIQRAYPQRTAIRISAAAGRLESIFDTKLLDRVDRNGRRYFAPNVSPRLPSWLNRDVVAVTGLDTRSVISPADIPAAGLTGASLAKAYDFAQLRAQGIDGSGQTIAVVSYDSFTASDLANYESHFGIKGPPVQRVTISGGTSPGSQQQEVNLDLDTIRAIAPGAQILDYEAPQGVNDADLINQIVADHKARVVSTSWGRCDLLLSPGQRLADENALAAARAAGITIFAASGDNGAYDCQAEDLTDQRLSVDWPAASENVVAVGGTRLSVRRDGSYLAEYGWEDVLQGVGSGGGLASVTPRPPWQSGAGVQNPDSDGHRQVPDVAGPADPDSGMVVYARGGAHEVGGTSAAAPFWAASTLLIRQYAQRHGAREPGFLAPLLYRLASDPRGAGALHTPVRGGNRHYSVASGWNYVSGLGSPDVAVLARALVAMLGHR